MSKVTIYSTSHCPFCLQAKRLLDSKNVDYEEFCIDADSSKRDEMIARCGRRTVPQIFIDDQHIGGCDDLYALEHRGQLNKLLNK